jgi:hypothetical protein
LLSSIVESTGFGIQLDLVPLARFGAVNTVRGIQQVLLEDQEPNRSEDSILRLILSFRDAIRRVDDGTLGGLIDEPPSLTGSPRWDAFLAAVVEDECGRRSAATPRWVNNPARFLKPFWYLSKNPALHDWEFATAPAAFIRHGVLVAAEELASV